MSVWAKGLAAVTGALPLGCTSGLGQALGAFTGSVLRIRRVEMLDAVARSFPEFAPAEHRRIAASVYRNLGRNLGECLTLAFGRSDGLLDRIGFRHEERFAKAFERGNGVLVLTAHTGNWELAAARTAVQGYPFSIVAKEFRGSLANEYVARMRERYGIDVWPRRRAYRSCLGALRKNGMIGFMLDQNMIRTEGVFVDFLGRPACTTPGLAYLSAQSGAPVVPAFARRTADGRHEMCVFDPIDPPPDRKPETIHRATQAYSRQVEAFIRHYPDQWNWIHRRWRTRPLGADADGAAQTRTSEETGGRTAFSVDSMPRDGNIDSSDDAPGRRREHEQQPEE